MAGSSLLKRSVCETCGDEGFKEALQTCTKCRIACEHGYCMRENPLVTSVTFVCADCSMTPVQNRITSDSVKAVPRINRNKGRGESSNPVPRWKKIPETSRMKLISPDEVRKLSCGGSKLSKLSFRVRRTVSVRPAMGLTKQTPSIPIAKNWRFAVMARKTNPIHLPPKKLEHPSPRSLQNRPGVLRNVSKALTIAEGSKAKVSDGAKYQGANEICRSILSEKLLQLLPYRPAVHPTWQGRIVDSAIPSEFNGKFVVQPASDVRAKAYKLLKAFPVLLKVNLAPIGNLLNELFVNRNPELSDVEMYIFPYEQNIKKYSEERDYLFEAMKTRNAFIKINIKGKPLLIFSSKLLDKSSQIMIKMQKKTSNFLWGIFLMKKKDRAILPGSSSQNAQQFDDGDVVNNDSQPVFKYNNHRNPEKQLQRHYRERD